MKTMIARIFCRLLHSKKFNYEQNPGRLVVVRYCPKCDLAWEQQLGLP